MNLLTPRGIIFIGITTSFWVLGKPFEPCPDLLSNILPTDLPVTSAKNTGDSTSDPSDLLTKIRATGSHPNVRVVSETEHGAFLKSELSDPLLTPVTESRKAKIFDFSQRVSTPSLTQCRGTFLFNHDTKKFLVLHSSLYVLDGSYALEIASLGQGRMSAIIIGPYSEEVPYLLNRGIPTKIISVPEAQRMTVVYEPSRKALEFSYTVNLPSQAKKYFLGSFSVLDN